jgi:hypothetical protein
MSQGSTGPPASVGPYRKDVLRFSLLRADRSLLLASLPRPTLRSCARPPPRAPAASAEPDLDAELQLAGGLGRP